MLDESQTPQHGIVQFQCNIIIHWTSHGTSTIEHFNNGLCQKWVGQFKVHSQAPKCMPVCMHPKSIGNSTTAAVQMVQAECAPQGFQTYRYHKKGEPPTPKNPVVLAPQASSEKMSQADPHAGWSWNRSSNSDRLSSIRKLDSI